MAKTSSKSSRLYSDDEADDEVDNDLEALDDETPDDILPTTIMKPSWPHFGGSAMAFLFAGYSILITASVFFPPLSFLIFPFLAAQGMSITIGAGIIGFLGGAVLGGWQGIIGYQHYRKNKSGIEDHAPRRQNPFLYTIKRGSVNDDNQQQNIPSHAGPRDANRDPQIPHSPSVRASAGLSGANGDSKSPSRQVRRG